MKIVPDMKAETESLQKTKTEMKLEMRNAESKTKTSKVKPMQQNTRRGRESLMHWSQCRRNGYPVKESVQSKTLQAQNILKI